MNISLIAEKLFAYASQGIFDKCEKFIELNLNKDNVNCLLNHGPTEKTILSATCEFVCKIEKQKNRAKYLNIIELLLAKGASPDSAISVTLLWGKMDVALRLVQRMSRNERAFELIRFVLENSELGEVKIIDVFKVFVSVDPLCVFPENDLTETCFHFCLKYGWSSAFTYLWNVSSANDLTRHLLHDIIFGSTRKGLSLLQYAEWKYMLAVQRQLNWYVQLILLLCMFRNLMVI